MVQTAAQNYAATGMWAQEEAVIGKASGGGLAIRVAFIYYSRFDCELNTTSVFQLMYNLHHSLLNLVCPGDLQTFKEVC